MDTIARIMIIKMTPDVKFQYSFSSDTLMPSSFLLIVTRMSEPFDTILMPRRMMNAQNSDSTML